MDGLKAWVETFLPASVVADKPLELNAIVGDAGFRQYFRVNTSPSLIAVSAPPAHSDNPAFIDKRNAFRAAGVRTPYVHAINFEQGYMLQEDLGDRLLLDELNAGRDLTDKAETLLWQIQQMPLDGAVFPDYSESELLREMNLFPEWFLTGLLKLDLDYREQQLVTDTFQLLVESALEQPRVVVHRDYHSRNLMLSEGGGEEEGGELAAIDFQDAVLGPVTYDLVSLLRDCYIRRPAEQIAQRVVAYHHQLKTAGLLADVTAARFMRWFDLMGLQRHIKVLGIFSRLWLRDGKPRYLNDLPLVFGYAMEQAGNHPELSHFADWLGSRIGPALSSQPWHTSGATSGEQHESNDIGGRPR